MAPINADVAEVEAQLSAIRVRRNGLAAQRGLAVALTAILLAAAVVVATALRGSTTLFAVATCLAGLAALGCAAYAAWRTRQEWLSLPATAHLADTHAALDDRLTTLLAVAPVAPTPVLRPLLIAQIVAARRRWGIDALAPQRLSRWLALVPLALAIFAATAFYARPPASAVTRHADAGPVQLAAAPLAGSVVQTKPGDEGLFSTASGDGTMTQGASTSTSRSAHRGNGGADGAKAAAAAGGDAGEIPGQAAAAPGEVADENGLDRLRQSIRETFGAPPAPGSGGAAGDKGGEAKRDGQNGAGDDSTQSAKDAPRPDGSASSAQATSGDRNDPASAEAQQMTPGAGPNSANQGSRGSGRGGAGTGGSNGVLGANGAPQEAAGQGMPMAIKLSAITGVSPSQTEPQRRNQDVPAAAANASRTGGSLPTLADEQLADVTMQQLDVGPEHEGIVRRIFTRE